MDTGATELMVINSTAGYYIGRLDVEGFPSSRESVEDYPDRGTAQEALDNGTYSVRSNP